MIMIFGKITYDDADLPSFDEARRLWGMRVDRTVVRSMLVLLGWTLLAVFLGFVDDLVFGLGLLLIFMANLYFQYRNLLWGLELRAKTEVPEE